MLKPPSFSLTAKENEAKEGPWWPAAGPKTRFAQTVWTLAPHATPPLRGVEWDFKNTIKPA